jgi:hypothetical protein
MDNISPAAFCAQKTLTVTGFRLDDVKRRSLFFNAATPSDTPMNIVAFWETFTLS